MSVFLFRPVTHCEISLISSDVAGGQTGGLVLGPLSSALLSAFSSGFALRGCRALFLLHLLALASSETFWVEIASGERRHAPMKTDERGRRPRPELVAVGRAPAGLGPTRANQTSTTLSSVRPSDFPASPSPFNGLLLWEASWPSNTHVYFAGSGSGIIEGFVEKLPVFKHPCLQPQIFARKFQ